MPRHRNLARSTLPDGIEPGAELCDGKGQVRAQLCELISRTPLSTLWSARPPGSKSQPADSVVKVASSPPDAQAAIQWEACAFSSLQHPGIVRLIHSAATYAIQGSAEPVRALILERLGQPLPQILSQHNQPPVRPAPRPADGRSTSKDAAATQDNSVASGTASLHSQALALPEVKHMTRQVLQALDYMHSNGWVHRDIKPGNIMTTNSLQPHTTPHTHTPHTHTHPTHQSHTTSHLSNHSHDSNNLLWKLIDFGSAAYVGVPNRNTPPKLLQIAQTITHTVPAHTMHDWGPLHTPAYAPIEDFLAVLPRTEGQSRMELGSTSAVLNGPVWSHVGNDSWSLGCVVYEAVTGHKLFDTRRCRRMLRACSHAHTAHDAHNDKTPATRGRFLTGLRWPWRRGKEHHASHGEPGSVGPRLGSDGSVRDSVCDSNGFSVDGIESEELQLWQMTHVLGPVDTEVLRRSQSALSVEYLDPEGYARLDHHPVAIRALQQAASSAKPTHETDSGAQCGLSPACAKLTRITDSVQGSDDFVALMPLGQRLRVEGTHLPVEELEPLTDFLSHLLKYESAERVTSAQALKHPWVTSVPAAKKIP